MDNYLYAFLMALTLSGPLAFSFEKNVQFYKNYLPLLAGILTAGAVFISWDIWFTTREVWSFSYDYTLDIKLLHLPIEEWAFFIVIPYACVFIYEVLNFYLNKPNAPALSQYITITLIIALTALAIMHQDKLYTLINFAFAVVMLILQLVFRTYKSYLTSFYIAYGVSLLPFLIVNGVLTATPVVLYNTNENLNLRAFTIPVEDFIYLLALFLLVINVYEKLKRPARIKG